jgi:DNA-binding PadR family transcriptional regulator
VTPVFGHGHLRLYLLSLLDESPKHGYELIQALEERFGGTYVPSAGTIYPRLGKLEEEGLVTKTADGRKTVYSITDAGRAELADRANELGGIEDEVTDSVRRLADEVRNSVNVAMKSLRADLAAAARDARTDARTQGRPDTQSTSTSDRHENGTGAGWDSDARAAARNNLQHAEIALSNFRHQVRSDLRDWMSHADLTEETIAVLTDGLGEVRDAVRESLRKLAK